MRDVGIIRAALRSAGLDRPLHYLARTGSTNDDARRLAEGGAPEGTLVVAGEQTAGRGRAGRRWSSPAGSSLSMSLILRPDGSPPCPPGALAMLGGLAAAEALEAVIAVPAELKWPNDVLLRRRKACGVLVEGVWEANRLDYAVLGIGVNVGAGSAPPQGSVAFPATSLEAEAGRPVGRLDVLVALVGRLQAWLPRTGGPDLAAAWEARLAFGGETVRVETPEGVWQGKVVGVTPEGALRLRLGSGEILRVSAGDVRLRPADDGQLAVDGG